MQIEHVHLDVNIIDYDSENPRITQYLATYENPDPETIAMALQPGDSKYIELKQAIKTNNGIINPIIVNKNNNKYVAVEGNTRLAIYKQFHQENKDSETWKKIPAVVYEDMSSTHINAVRLQAHLVGVRNWTPYSKAKYLYTLSEMEHMPLSELVDFCGGNKIDVIRNIEAYKRMEFDYRPLVSGDSFDQHKFSNFLEMQKPNIYKAIVEAGFNNKDFSQWVYQGKFEPRQELVRRLPGILKNPRAREVFLNENADKASAYIDRPEISKELEQASLIELCTAIQEKINKITLGERDEIRDDEEKSVSIDDTASALTNFYVNEIDNK